MSATNSALPVMVGKLRGMSRYLSYLSVSDLRAVRGYSKGEFINHQSLEILFPTTFIVRILNIFYFHPLAYNYCHFYA